MSFEYDDPYEAFFADFYTPKYPKEDVSEPVDPLEVVSSSPSPEKAVVLPSHLQEYTLFLNGCKWTIELSLKSASKLHMTLKNEGMPYFECQVDTKDRFQSHSVRYWDKQAKQFEIKTGLPWFKFRKSFLLYNVKSIVEDVRRTLYPSREEVLEQALSEEDESWEWALL